MIDDSLLITVLIELGFWAVIVTAAFLVAFMPVNKNKPKKCIVPTSSMDCARGPNDKCPYLEGLPFGASEDK